MSVINHYFLHIWIWKHNYCKVAHQTQEKLSFSFFENELLIEKQMEFLEENMFKLWDDFLKSFLKKRKFVINRAFVSLFFQFSQALDLLEHLFTLNW